MKQIIDSSVLEALIESIEYEVNRIKETVCANPIHCGRIKDSATKLQGFIFAVKIFIASQKIGEK